MSSSKPHILIVEDDRLHAAGLHGILTDNGYSAVIAGSLAAAEQQLTSHVIPLVLLDLHLPDGHGQDVLARWRRDAPDRAVIVLTGAKDVDTAVACLKAGALDFLTKPVATGQLLRAVEIAWRQNRLQLRAGLLQRLQDPASPTADGPTIVAESAAMRSLLETAATVAANAFSSLLITGESGTGKGLLAAAIHRASPRADAPFVAVNCAASVATLWESEFFGHLRGAFTDAKEDRPGLMEMADGGVLFLDEIGDMPLDLQAKLLKVIEEKTFRRLGSATDIHVDVTIIAATNQDLPSRVADGRFRQDLYYRLAVIPLRIPPLRERPEDILPVADAFRADFAARLGKELPAFSAAARQTLTDYPWPGNVRELRNVVERGCILCPGGTIDTPHLLMPASHDIPNPTGSHGGAPPETLAAAEKRAIATAMRHAAGNKNRAADLLGIHRSTLYAKLKLYDLEG